ncbi:hypothetical protein V5O48_010328 [Marasmius crinis-equi]|uniref:Uncharacterized protein n=1 Tax=Marasmius crinis-equi TaxID=585013 RepID=A0ABR3F967_9AGAR
MKLCCVSLEELWMDPTRGIFCRGPIGPTCYEGTSIITLDKLPTDVEMLKEDVLLRRLGQLGCDLVLDRKVAGALGADWSESRYTISESNSFMIDSTTITLGQARKSRMALSTTGVKRSGTLENGYTRFVLEEEENLIQAIEVHLPSVLLFPWDGSWLAQSLSVFHKYGVPLDSDLGQYRILEPDNLVGKLSYSLKKRNRRKNTAPIYLFVMWCRPSSSFWSFDEDGQTPIPASLCNYFGLPPRFEVQMCSYQWPTKAYRSMRDYQIAAGFDPTTLDFATHGNFNFNFTIFNDAHLPGTLGESVVPGV